MPQAFILSAARTPIGKYGGGLAGMPAVDLARAAVVAALERAHPLIPRTWTA